MSQTHDEYILTYKKTHKSNKFTQEKLRIRQTHQEQRRRKTDEARAGRPNAGRNPRRQPTRGGELRLTG